MTERDTDIDFDFFEEEEPPTQESSRADRVIRRPGGPRGPQRPPRAPANLTPLLRLVGLIAFAILIIVLLVFWIQSCNEASKTATYKNYMSKVDEVSSSSQQIGRQLSQALLAQGLKQAEVERRISGLARQEQVDVDRAREITPPGALRDEHDSLIEALQFRVSGLNGLASALAATAKTKDLTRAGSVLASQMQRLLASDVIYDDSFKAPSSAELKRQGVTGTSESGGPLVPDSNFLQTADLATTTSMVNVLSKIRGGAVTPSQGGLRGTNIVKTDADHRPHQHGLPGHGRGLGRLAGDRHPGHAQDRAVERRHHHEEADDPVHQPGRAESGRLHQHPGGQLRLERDHQGRGAAGAGRDQDRQQLRRLPGHLLRLAE
jgi:hypothetical protein